MPLFCLSIPSMKKYAYKTSDTEAFQNTFMFEKQDSLNYPEQIYFYSCIKSKYACPEQQVATVNNNSDKLMNKTLFSVKSLKVLKLTSEKKDLVTALWMSQTVVKLICHRIYCLTKITSWASSTGAPQQCLCYNTPVTLIVNFSYDDLFRKNHEKSKILLWKIISHNVADNAIS